MINIFRSVSLLLLLLLGSGSFAQTVPGYLGKRNIISYRGLIGPGFQPSGPEIFGFSELGRPQASPDGLFNNGLFYENQLNFERVMSRKFSLRAALSQQSFHFGSSLIDDDGYYPSSERERYMSLQEFVPGRALGFEVGARWYYQQPPWAGILSCTSATKTYLMRVLAFFARRKISQDRLSPRKLAA